MMTAAVRDLHRCYPGRFLTGVDTTCAELWENNPYVACLRAEDPGVEALDCSYPLIDRCNHAPYHCLHGFIDFLNRRLGLRIRPTAFRGDIHLSEAEKGWMSQFQELAGEEIPFWIVAAGGKHDISIKWWESARYQQVVDRFRGRIQFVQVGQRGDHHPRLQGVVDLRGRTDFRQLIRLVYHAQGVLCGVTSLMHLAAAVETRSPRGGPRPCVAIAGGREPAHWEAYPGHQFIHNTGTMDCCHRGGCWKDRYAPLGDGDPRDRPQRRCRQLSHGLPRCMDAIDADEVVRRIEGYFLGGTHRYLTSGQLPWAQRAVRAARATSFDRQPLRWRTAGQSLACHLAALPPYPERCRGRGWVLCADGPEAVSQAVSCARTLRALGCRLPIELWLPRPAPPVAAPLPPDVAWIDARRLRRAHPTRRLCPDRLAAYAILHSRFQEVLYWHASRPPRDDLERLFDTALYRARGAVFARGEPLGPEARRVWHSCGLAFSAAEAAFADSPIVLDKKRCWPAVCLAAWLDANADFYGRFLRPGGAFYRLAFARTRTPFARWAPASAGLAAPRPPRAAGTAKVR